MDSSEVFARGQESIRGLNGNGKNKIYIKKLIKYKKYFAEIQQQSQFPSL